eukprot:scaffold112173_cov56-Attheya_sp.AAC.4
MELHLVDEDYLLSPQDLSGLKLVLLASKLKDASRTHPTLPPPHTHACRHAIDTAWDDLVQQHKKK